MRRAFWVALGLGAGATSAVMASRWAKRQANRVAPATIARETRGGLLDLGKLVAESIEEGKRASVERERQLRERYVEEGRPEAQTAARSGDGG
jgi:hypothetical protein